MDLITTSLLKSTELLKVINRLRKSEGEKSVRLNDFNARILDEIGDSNYENFVVKNKNKTESIGYMLNEDQMMLIGMRESKAVRKKVLAWIREVELKNNSELMRAKSRDNARLEAPMLTDAIKYSRKEKVKHYDFSNEFDMINRTVLGVNAKQYRVANGLAPNQPIRDTLTPCEIAAIEHMQRLDTGMIELGFSYDKRKSELNRVFITRHNKALCEEVKRLES